MQQEDVLIRALKFLDTMVQRNDMEKAGFLKDLSTFWERFDERVLTNKVGPPTSAILQGRVVVAMEISLNHYNREWWL